MTLAHSFQPTLFPNKSFLGRGSPSIVKTKMTAPVSGPCRVGDFDVTSDDLPTVGRQRLRQVRRLISARHQLARADNSPLALSSFYDTWSAILQARASLSAFLTLHGTTGAYPSLLHLPLKIFPFLDSLLIRPPTSFLHGTLSGSRRRRTSLQLMFLALST